MSFNIIAAIESVSCFYIWIIFTKQNPRSNKSLRSYLKMHSSNSARLQFQSTHVSNFVLIALGYARVIKFAVFIKCITGGELHLAYWTNIFLYISKWANIWDCIVYQGAQDNYWLVIKRTRNSRLGFQRVFPTSKYFLEK